MYENKKKLSISIIIPLVLGSILSMFSKSKETYSILEKPFLSPPGIVFPIVWSVLFILMGISSYLIYKTDDKEIKSALTIYGLQLLLNVFWPIIFFRYKLFLISIIWIILIIILVVMMIIKFYKIDKKAAYVQIPYFTWLLFALYLSIMIYKLN